MALKNISTPLTVTLALLIIMFVMFIAMTATTEADTGFRTSSKERQGMSEYYANCPFKKAEVEDASSQQSIRDQVKFVDVSCDPENELEQVTLELIGSDKDQAKVAFQNWLKRNSLQEGERLIIKVAQYP